MSTVEFVTPPPTKKRYDWSAIAEQMRGRPMEWGRVFEGDRVSVANAVRQGSVSAVHPDLGFEVRTTNNEHTENGRLCTLWLRFNPSKIKSPLRETLSQARATKES